MCMIYDLFIFNRVNSLITRFRQSVQDSDLLWLEPLNAVYSQLFVLLREDFM